jgi:hypothetical protein
VFLDFQKWDFVVKSQFSYCLVLITIEIQPLLCFHREKQIEYAFAHRRNHAYQARIPVFKDDLAPRNNHHCICLMGLQKSPQRFEPRRGEAFRGWSGMRPFDAGDYMSLSIVESLRG